jgi:hypothetical protein
MVGRPFLQRFVSEAIHRRVVELARERLAQELEEGYRAEAANPSLDLEWATIEVKGL